MQPTKKIENFKHLYKLKVRLYEVDILQIVNNAVYFNYFEQARIQYAKNAGLLPDDNIFSEESLYYMVHNEINYLKPAFLMMILIFIQEYPILNIQVSDLNILLKIRNPKK